MHKKLPYVEMKPAFQRVHTGKYSQAAIYFFVYVSLQEANFPSAYQRFLAIRRI